MNIEQKYTVFELTKLIKSSLENSFSSVWIEGEISNFNKHSSGHFYFSLKDENAQISAVMWRGKNSSLNFLPVDGMKVLAKGRITLFEKRGNYQIDIDRLEPLGLGDLQEAFEKLKKKLLDEGLFEHSRKKQLPFFAEKIGIVTSPTGAAVRDMISVAKRRFPGVELILNPVRVQGEGAAEEIAEAIEEFNDYGEVDLIIAGRGGGSLEDLWAFNEEVVARAIAASELPVVSAVGHEVDFTIADFVADLRAPTPSAAAELVVRDSNEIWEAVQRDVQRLAGISVDRIAYYSEKINYIENSRSFQAPVDLLKQYTLQIDHLSEKMDGTFTNIMDMRNERLDGFEKRLLSLDPKSVMNRGYSIVYDKESGDIISSSSKLKSGDNVKLQFKDGENSAIVN